jgi:hypothetical protein
MTTTTVKRGAGRPAAAARTAKAAQRSPAAPDLPKTEEEFVETASAILTGKPARRTDATLSAPKPPVSDAPARGSRRERAAQRTPITQTEQAKAVRAKERTAQRTTPEPVAEPKSGAERPARAAKPGATTRGPRKAAAAPSATVPAGFVGADKAQALVEFAAGHGWGASVEAEPGGATIVVSLARGEQSVTVTFTDGKLDLERMPSYVKAEGAKAVQLKNVSAARKIIEAQS